MFNKGQLTGILLSIAKPEIHVSRANNTNIGYRVRVRVNFRGSDSFILGLQRTLEQQGITGKYKEKEHKSRPRPILSVGGPDELPDAKNVWPNFKEVIELIDNGEHHTLEGLDKILTLKGEL